MKKAYTKPEIVIENFLVSEHIAACSSEDEFFNNVGSSMEDLIEFGKALTSSETCWIIVEEGYKYETGNNKFYCYFTSAAGSTIFSS